MISEPSRSESSRTTEGFVSAAGSDLYHVSVGDGPPLLILGGTSLGHSYLRPAMDRLSDQFRVIYFDQRGSGRSPLGAAEGLSIDRSIADIVSLLDSLDLSRASILGHSIGGNLALLFAAARPDRVIRLVAAMPGPPFDEQGMAWETLEAAMSALRTPQDDEEMSRIQHSEAFQRRDPAAVEAFIRNMYLPFFTDRTAAATLPYALTENGAATAPEQEGMLFGSLDTAATIASLTGITARTLVLSGELDPIPESFAVLLAGTIPDSVHRRLTGAGHFAFVEQPDLFFAAVREFLIASP